MATIKKLAPSITAMGVFISGMAFLFLHEKTTINHMMLAVCGLYSLVCLLFLAFQMYAFFRVHMEYDEEMERVKYQVFEAEGMDYIEQEII